MLGSIIADLEGTALTPEDSEILQHPLIGGVVLFTRNYESPEQLRELTSTIRSVCGPDFLITVDHEGGAVQRFLPGFTRLPPMAQLGEHYELDANAALTSAETLGFVMASELKACGVDLSFAPVLDLNKGISRVLAKGRAISADPDVVTTIALAYMKGMNRAGMMAIGKHFPGHGSVEIDSHLGLPVDTRSFADICADDLIPFQRLIQEGLSGIMPAHIIFSAVDDKPASLSTVWLKDILRHQLHFKGTVFSDCLSMAGAAQLIESPVERVRQALAAGCDKALLCNDRIALKQVLEGL